MTAPSHRNRPSDVAAGAQRSALSLFLSAPRGWELTCEAECSGCVFYGSEEFLCGEVLLVVEATG